MRRISVVTSLVLAAAAPGAARAEIALFGDARLGIGYNIDNDGEPRLEPTRSRDGVDTTLGAPEDELRAVSRVRFGVTMSGESDSGIGFGASIRADNAPGGQGGSRGQRSGEVFVSGNLGTLGYGDIDGADYNRVGDPIGNATLTGLGDFNELPFLSNGGGSDNDELQFLANPDDRPTVRYDYDAASFGVSLSTTRDLDAFGVGANYTVEFAEGSVTFGGGYYDFEEFEGDVPNFGEVTVPAGNQWSAALRGRYAGFRAGLGFTSIDAGDLGELDVLTGGVGYGFEQILVLAYYSTVTSGDAFFGEALDGRDSYGASLQYDLGGGITLNTGVARSYGADRIGEPGEAEFRPAIDAVTLADFGLSMRF
jgi:outer membrane protein OmpU